MCLVYTITLLEKKMQERVSVSGIDKLLLRVNLEILGLLPEKKKNSPG